MKSFFWKYSSLGLQLHYKMNPLHIFSYEPWKNFQAIFLHNSSGQLLLECSNFQQCFNLKLFFFSFLFSVKILRWFSNAFPLKQPPLCLCYHVLALTNYKLQQPHFTKSNKNFTAPRWIKFYQVSFIRI